MSYESFTTLLKHILYPIQTRPIGVFNRGVAQLGFSWKRRCHGDSSNGLILQFGRVVAYLTELWAWIQMF